MKKIAVVVLALAMVMLAVAVAPAVSAQPNKPLRCEVAFHLNWDWIGVGGSSPIAWIGTFSGDIDGTFTITPVAATFPGILEHYSETWNIVTVDGEIEIHQEGVWSFKTFKFKSNGYVATATGAWEYLSGANAFARGVTTQFPVDYPTPVTAEGIMWICGFGPE